MEQLFGEEWLVPLILSISLTWGIGLAPPLLIRFILVAKPIGKKLAISLVAMFWFMNIVLFTALGSVNKSHAVLFFIAWASYAILRKNVKENKKDKWSAYSDETGPLILIQTGPPILTQSGPPVGAKRRWSFFV